MSAQTPSSDLAENWRASGKYFTWTSPLPENQGRTVQVFYTCIGDAAKPTVMMLHGFPTSSFDFRLLAHELEPDFRSCMLDFPGYGLSDKPLAGYRYTLTDDAQLVWHFVTKVVPSQQPAAIARVMRLTLGVPAAGSGVPVAPFNLTTDVCGPVLVAREQKP